jgi:hypothetical protein
MENSGQFRAGERRKGQFLPGQSGNPSGKPKGAKNTRTLILEALQREFGVSNKQEAEKRWYEHIAHQAIAAGDLSATQMLIKRIAPERKATELPVQIGLDTSQPAPDLAREILQRVASGELSVEQGTKLLGAVAQQQALAQGAELERRLAALEKQVDD